MISTLSHQDARPRFQGLFPGLGPNLDRTPSQGKGPGCKALGEKALGEKALGAISLPRDSGNSGWVVNRNKSFRFVPLENFRKKWNF